MSYEVEFNAIDWAYMKLDGLPLWQEQLGYTTSAEVEERMRRLIPMIISGDSLYALELFPDGGDDLSLGWRSGDWNISVSIYEDDGPAWYVFVRAGKEDEIELSVGGSGDLPPDDVVQVLRKNIDRVTEVVTDANPDWKLLYAEEEREGRNEKAKRQDMKDAGIESAIAEGWL